MLVTLSAALDAYAASIQGTRSIPAIPAIPAIRGIPSILGFVGFAGSETPEVSAVRIGLSALMLLLALTFAPRLACLVAREPLRTEETREEGGASPVQRVVESRVGASRWLRGVVMVSIWIAAIVGVAVIWLWGRSGFLPDNPRVLLTQAGYVLTRVAISLLVLAVALALGRSLDTGIELALERGHVNKNLLVLAGHAIYAATVIVGMIVILSVWGVSLVVPVTLIGVITVALSLALQDVLKNVVCGVYLLIERPFVISDEIAVASSGGTFTGIIEDIQIRVTHLYVQTLQQGLGSRWVDVYENVGKRSGAYSGGAYGTQPFVLLNYQDTLDDMFTLAHELGHSMHSYFTRRTQPYPYGDYTIFVAEVASTLNEALLTHYLLQQTQDRAVRMSLLNHAMETYRTTLYRQTLFAEFEQQAHARAEAGEALTPELLDDIFKRLNELYYGPVVDVDDAIKYEWSRIPHFYSSFYVYQYATGIAASAALAQQILNEGEPAARRYLRFLSSGSSEYSIDLLRGAGVDLASPAPVQAALDTFGRYIDEMEQLVQANAKP